MSNSQQQHDQIADQKCFLRTVAAFRDYQQAASRICEKRRQDWKTGIADGHREILEFAITATKIQQQESIKNNDNASSSAQTLDSEHLSKLVKEFKPTTPTSSSSNNTNTNNWSPKHFDTQLHCIAQNQKLLNDISLVAEEDLFDDYFPNKDPRARGRPLPRPRNIGIPTHLDQDKVFSTLRQIVRDWSQEGASERKEVYDYFYEALEKEFPHAKERNDVTVLVPGGGLSRLMVEIAARGFSARGNEFSYHMLMTGHYIMNHVHDNNSYTIFPYCDVALNHWARDMQFQAITFPDQSAVDMFRNSEETHKTNGHGDLSMVAGDFVEVFMKPEEAQQWNAVASCFFLDTAHNIVEYLQVIHQCLVPGGLLINVGPLLFHWADSFEDVSIEISYDELKRLLWAMGFEIIHEKIVKTNYTNNSNAMKQNFYQCPAFVARKVEPKYKPQGSTQIDPDRYFVDATNKNKKNNTSNSAKNNNKSSAAASSVPSSSPATSTSPAPPPPSYHESNNTTTSSSENGNSSNQNNKTRNNNRNRNRNNRNRNNNNDRKE